MESPISNNDDIQKLLEIATSSNEPIKHDNPEVLQFIEELGITSGTAKVPTYTLYYTYVLWRDKRKKLNRPTFFKETAKYFDRVQGSGTNNYLLNAEPFDLTTEGFFAARAQLRRERYAKEKKKNKKK
jgi:hypothetical protein